MQVQDPIRNSTVVVKNSVDPLNQPANRNLDHQQMKLTEPILASNLNERAFNTIEVTSTEVEAINGQLKMSKPEHIGSNQDIYGPVNI